MYPPKAPPIRPRSSLSTEENHRIKDTHRRHLHSASTNQRPNKALLTLAAVVFFLVVLCCFLLGALVYVGRTIAEQKQTVTGINLTDLTDNLAYVFPPPELRLSTKPILRFRPTLTAVDSATPPTLQTSNTLTAITILPASIMAASKILSQLTFRLPREVRPHKYQLRLQPDLRNKTFTGSVNIRVEVLQPIAFIPVHAKLLNVSTSRVQLLDESDTPVDEVAPVLTFEHPQFEYWVTEFAHPLKVGNYSLQLNFNGSLTDRIVGFYQSSYMDEQRKQRRWIATSKFEPTYARQAFPCFDEPAMKAEFTITVVRPSGDGYHALSNMNVERETVNGDLTEVEFAESVPMSTYLACFIVSDFAYQAKTVKGILEGASDFEMRVFSTSAQVNKVKYALETGVGITEFYIQYFNVAYPLPKLDMAAIPDFVSGAMEHWGLVTYRETSLLYDENISSSRNQQRVATVVAHELAHMWFGNLVTMKWWNDLWLNEGFANYIEYKGVDKVHPDWQMLDQFIIEDMHDVMRLDATLASHPIVQSVENPSQITELFDSITYSKGASVIRMLEDLVGEEKFKNATTSYLNKFFYGNAETDDFLTEIEAQEFDFDVKLIMQTWTEQSGYPVVEVTRNGNTCKLTQKRFFSNPEDYDAVDEQSTFNYRWSIPITYTTSDSAEVHRTIFDYNDNEVSITLPKDVDWLKLNTRQMGYYRVNYPAEMWLALTTTLIKNRGVFSPADRAHLINDALVLADAAQLPYSTALNLTTYLEKELDYVPWSVGMSRLDAIADQLYYTDYYRDFVIYVRKLLIRSYDAVTWDVGTDHLQNLLRVTIISAACRFGHKDALQEAASRFNDWLSDPNVRPKPDIRSMVYYYGMQAAGSEKVWDQVWQLYLVEQDAQEKVKLLSSLAAIKEPWILQRFINMAWNESNVRGQDYFSCLETISLNRVGQSLVWDYVRENWPRLVQRFGINERYLGRMIPRITEMFASQTKLEEMEVFFAKYPEAGAGTAARKEALASVKYNIKWLEQNKEQVGRWLHDTQSDKGKD